MNKKAKRADCSILESSTSKTRGEYIPYPGTSCSLNLLPEIVKRTKPVPSFFITISSLSRVKLLSLQYSSRLNIISSSSIECKIISVDIYRSSNKKYHL